MLQHNIMLSTQSIPRFADPSAGQWSSGTVELSSCPLFPLRTGTLSLRTPPCPVPLHSSFPPGMRVPAQDKVLPAPPHHPHDRTSISRPIARRRVGVFPSRFIFSLKDMNKIQFFTLTISCDERRVIFDLILNRKKKRLSTRFHIKLPIRWKKDDCVWNS